MRARIENMNWHFMGDGRPSGVREVIPVSTVKWRGLKWRWNYIRKMWCQI